jgi:hypothetical protein
MLFSSLYRSWCHNAVAVFALCLLAQAYEHASNLLQILYVGTAKANGQEPADGFAVPSSNSPCLYLCRSTSW